MKEAIFQSKYGFFIYLLESSTWLEKFFMILYTLCLVLFRENRRNRGNWKKMLLTKKGISYENETKDDMDLYHGNYNVGSNTRRSTDFGGSIGSINIHSIFTKSRN